MLLPLNAWRLSDMPKLIRDIDAALKTDMNATWLLRYMRPKSFKAGDVMMTRGKRTGCGSSISRTRYLVSAFSN